MTEEEYVKWMWNDCFNEVGKGLLIYVVLVGAYWAFVG